MRTILFVAIQGIFWYALYLLVPRLTDEKAILAAFVTTLVISMTTTAVFLAGRK